MLNKHVLVTGGSGFIGSHLCENLLDSEFEVLCVDNYFTGSKSEICFHDLPPDDPKQRQPNITLATEILGCNPTTNLKVGLLKTIEYFEKLI